MRDVHGSVSADALCADPRMVQIPEYTKDVVDGSLGLDGVADELRLILLGDEGTELFVRFLDSTLPHLGHTTLVVCIRPNARARRQRRPRHAIRCRTLQVSTLK